MVEKSGNKALFFTMVCAKGQRKASHKDTPASLITPEKVSVSE